MEITRDTIAALLAVVIIGIIFIGVQVHDIESNVEIEAKTQLLNQILATSNCENGETFSIPVQGGNIVYKPVCEQEANPTSK